MGRYTLLEQPPLGWCERSVCSISPFILALLHFGILGLRTVLEYMWVQKYSKIAGLHCGWMQRYECACLPLLKRAAFLGARNGVSLRPIFILHPPADAISPPLSSSPSSTFPSFLHNLLMLFQSFLINKRRRKILM